MLYVIREGVHCVFNFMSSREFIMSLVLVQRHMKAEFIISNAKTIHS